MSLKNKVMSGLRWSAGMRLFGQLFTWLVTIFVIRLLSPEDYGLMAMAGVFIAFFSMVSEMGLGSAIVQRRDLTHDQLKSIFGFILVVSLCLSVLMIIASPFISKFYSEPELIPILCVLSLIFLFSGLAVVPRSLLLKDLRYREIATAEFLSAISGSVVTLIMALLGCGVWSLIGGFLAIRITLLLAVHYAQPFFFLPKLSFSGMKKVFSYSGQITLSRIFWYLYFSASGTLIIGKMLGSEILGFYTVGITLAFMLMDKVSGILNQVAFPAFSSIQDNPSLSGEYLIKAVRLLCFITIPVFWGISSLSSEIVYVFLGDKWAASIVPLQIVSLIVPLCMVRNLFHPVLIGLGRANLDLKNEIVGVVLLPLSFLIAANFGLIGVSLVWVIIFPIVFIINLENTRKVLGISFLAIYQALWRPAVCGFIMVSAVTITKNTMLVKSYSILNIAALVLIGILTYALTTLVINRLVFNEALALTRS